MILAGDIGGTRARLMLVERGAKKPVRIQVFESRAYRSLEAVVTEFLGEKPPPIDAACFGVAGPVIDQKSTATNLPWIIDARVLARKLRLPSVLLINDLVALAFGALSVSKSKLVSLQNGTPATKRRNVAVIAAGTGLGEAALIWDGTRFVPLATEGGHTDFAARDDLEFELLRFLKERLKGRVSYERVLSGNGLGNLYDFFRSVRGVRESKRVSEMILAARDRNAEISRLGMSGDSSAASKAIDTFVSLYGAEAGNLALKTLSVGGVFVAGNIAKHMLPRLQSGAFVTSFTTKGRFSTLTKQMPVAVVLDTEIGLAGSAYYASTHDRATESN